MVWIKINHAITETPLYFSEPFTRMQAWLDMLIIANYDSSTLHIRGTKVEVKRGQIAKSQESLAERWKWSRGKVLRFLSELEAAGQIVQQKSNVINLISIVYYDNYHNDDTTAKVADGTTDSTTNGTTENAADGTTENDIKDIDNERYAESKNSRTVQQKMPQTVQQIVQQTVQQTENNKEKKVSKEKKAINNINIKEKSLSIDIERVKKKREQYFYPPTLDEVKEHISEKGYNVDAESFIAFYESKGWYIGKNKMKNWRMALVTWEKRNKHGKYNNRRKPFEATATSAEEYEGKF